VHGANRLGSNSLLDLVIFGREAARRCAETVKPGSRHRPLAADAGQPAIARLDRLRNANGARTTAAIRVEMQKTMQLDAAVFRSGESLAQGIERIGATFASFAEVRITDRSLIWNSDLIETFELENLLLQPRPPSIRRRIVPRAAARTRARTSRQRDDRNWLKHTLVWIDGPAACPLRLPPRASEYPDGRRRVDPAQGAHLLKDCDGEFRLPLNSRPVKGVTHAAPAVRARCAPCASIASIRTAAATRAWIPSSSTPAAAVQWCSMR